MPRVLQQKLCLTLAVRPACGNAISSERKGTVTKRLEASANLAILVTCVLVSGLMLRDRFLARGASTATSAESSLGSDRVLTITPEAPRPLADLGPPVSLVPVREATAGATLVTLDGGAILADQLDAIVAPQMIAVRSQEYTIKRAALDQALERVLLEREASRRATSIDELARVEITDKAPPVTASEIETLYQNSASRFTRIPPEQARQIIRNELTQARLTARRQAFVRKLRDRAGVRVYLEAPRTDVDPGGGASRGPEGAPVTIVEFADFQCPYCARSQATLRELEEKYPNKIRIVFRHFPLPIHKDAPIAAEAAECARKQGRFWEMHDLLFSTASFAPADLSRLAEQTGADANRFASCLKSGEHQADWRRDRSDGERYGVASTPTFFVNGRPLVGAQPLEAFADVIDEELARRTGRTGKAVLNAKR